jgi:hypothetical protein
VNCVQKERDCKAIIIQIRYTPFTKLNYLYCSEPTECDGMRHAFPVEFALGFGALQTETNADTVHWTELHRIASSCNDNDSYM